MLLKQELPVRDFVAATPSVTPGLSNFCAVLPYDGMPNKTETAYQICQAYRNRGAQPKILPPVADWAGMIPAPLGDITNL